MLRAGQENGLTLISKLLASMIHQHDMAVPHLETNAEGVMPYESESSATT